eukprot:15363486-Ditylum_brightwellii.AAC.1
MITEIQHTAAVSNNDSTNKWPNQDMTSTTIIDSDREDGSKDSSKMPASESFFNGINSSSTVTNFQILIKCNSINGITVSAMDMAKELELNRREQGSILMEKKVKSLQQHWFSEPKVTKTVPSYDPKSSSEENTFNECDTLVQLWCNHGKSESVEYY